MKIGIDLRPAQGPQPTGVGQYALALTRALLGAQSPHRFILFSNAFRGISPPPNIPTGKARHASLAIPNKLLNTSLFALRRPFLDDLVGGVDCFFLPNLNFASFSRSCRLVATVHDLSFLRFPYFFSPRRRLWHFLIGVRGTLNRADAIIVPSERTKEDLGELLAISANKIHVIPWGLDATYQHGVPEALRMDAREKLSLPHRFILYVGALEPRKNIVGLIEAYNLFRTQFGGADAPSLVLAGPAGWLYREIFRARDRSPYREDIRIIGYVSEEAKYALYQLAEFFVYPSFYEGFGFQLLEAMASGCPILTSAVASIPEITDTAAVLVDPYNLADLAQGMHHLHTDAKLRELLVSRGRERAKRFTWEETAKKTLAVLEEVIA